MSNEETQKPVPVPASKMVELLKVVEMLLPRHHDRLKVIGTPNTGRNADKWGVGFDIGDGGIETWDRDVEAALMRMVGVVQALDNMEMI